MILHQILITGIISKRSKKVLNHSSTVNQIEIHIKAATLYKTNQDVTGEVSVQQPYRSEYPFNWVTKEVSIELTNLF